MDVTARERRASLRQMVGPLTYVKLDGANGGIVVDLCENGMRVHSVAPLASGKPVQVEFSLPGSSSVLRTSGKVAWADATGQGGIHFSAPQFVKRDINDWIFGSFLSEGDKSQPALPALAQPSAEKQLQAMAVAESPAPRRDLRRPRLVSQVRRARPGLRAAKRTHAPAIGDMVLVLIGLAGFAASLAALFRIPAATLWPLLAGMIAASVVWLGYLGLFRLGGLPGRELEKFFRERLRKERRPLSLF